MRDEKRHARYRGAAVLYKRGKRKKRSAASAFGPRIRDRNKNEALADRHSPPSCVVSTCLQRMSLEAGTRRFLFVISHITQGTLSGKAAEKGVVELPRPPK